jgi:hypothetical protein
VCVLVCTSFSLIPSRSRYELRLFDVYSNTWKDVAVDDRLQIEEDIDGNRELHGAKVTPSEEIWPCIYEKGVASLLGGYDALDSIDPLVAFKILTVRTRVHIDYSRSGMCRHFCWTQI